MDQKQYQYLVERVENIDRKFDDKLDKILQQTTKTNGRVTSLEKEFDEVSSEVKDLSKSSNFNKGRDRVLWLLAGAIGAVVVSVINYLLQKH